MVDIILIDIDLMGTILMGDINLIRDITIVINIVLIIISYSFLMVDILLVDSFMFTTFKALFTFTYIYLMLFGILEMLFSNLY